jgi:PIN domain nuclease of toxin-antitoxin system
MPSVTIQEAQARLPDLIHKLTPGDEVVITEAIKISIGKWKLNRTYEEFIDIGLNKYGFKVLPILPPHTARVIGLPFHHKDPFDRLLVAQALAEGIPIVSNDPAFDAYGITRLW